MKKRKKIKEKRLVTWKMQNKKRTNDRETDGPADGKRKNC